MRKVVLVMILSFLALGMMPGASPVAGSAEGGVCMAFFYAPNSDNYQKIEPFIQQMEENFSFLHVEEYSVDDYNELFLVIKEKYNISYDAPLIFIGNEWYYLDPWEGNLEQAGVRT